MIQIIASDMDGTLLNDKMVISKRNADAIKEAQKNGVHFISQSSFPPFFPSKRRKPTMSKLYMLDYGAGNVRSIINAVNHLGYQITFIKDPSEIALADVTIRDTTYNNISS